MGQHQIYGVCSGWAVYNQTMTWANIRVATANFVLSFASNGPGIMASPTTDRYSYLSRHRIAFNTASIGTDEIVTSAIIVITGFSTHNGLGYSDANMGITLVNYTGTADSSASNYASIGTARMSNDLAKSTYSYLGTANFILSATGISQIDVTGNTYYGMRGVGELDDVTPTWMPGADAAILYTIVNANILPPFYAPLLIVNTVSNTANVFIFASAASERIGTTEVDPGGVRLGIRKEGSTYYIPLVSTDNARASSFRVHAASNNYAAINLD